jgi:hypothetical protein
MALTGRIFIKFGIGEFSSICREILSFFIIVEDKTVTSIVFIL